MKLRWLIDINGEKRLQVDVEENGWWEDVPEVTQKLFCGTIKEEQKQ